MAGEDSFARLSYCRSRSVICVAAQVARTQLHHIYWLVRPLKAKSCLCLMSCWGVCVLLCVHAVGGRVGELREEGEGAAAAQI